MLVPGHSRWRLGYVCAGTGGLTPLATVTSYNAGAADWSPALLTLAYQPGGHFVLFATAVDETPAANAIWHSGLQRPLAQARACRDARPELSMPAAGLT